MTSAPTLQPAVDRKHAASLPRPVRRRRPLLAASALLLGVLVWLVVGTGLERASARIQVWSLASSVSRGELVQPAHLSPTDVAVADRSAVLEVTDTRVDGLLGGVWATDLPAGTLISPGLVLERQQVEPGQALVGVALPPGGWPLASLRAGDAVMVVRTGNPPGVLVDRATVDSVTPLGDAVSGTRLVTLAVPQGAAADVGAAAASDDVVLVVVP